MVKQILVFFLKVIKRLRGFDKSFQVYYPKDNSSRELLLWKLMVLNPLLYLDVNLRKRKSSKKIIDIYIPASIKDIKSLPLVIKGAKNNINHHINKIYIVAIECLEISSICKEFGAIHVNETAVLGYNKTNINYTVNNDDRSGWLFQQLLKLNADTIVEMEDYLILDADTIFTQPRLFHYKGKTIFDFSQEKHMPYYRVYEKILKRKPQSELSFITHYMLFNKTSVKKLKAEIESIHNKEWDKVILENVDYSNISGFSEYELYGNYLLETCPSSIKKEYWFNTNSYSATVPNYIKSISIHSYLNN